jgi:hypothetical protein
MTREAGDEGGEVFGAEEAGSAAADVEGLEGNTRASPFCKGRLRGI